MSHKSSEVIDNGEIVEFEPKLPISHEIFPQKKKVSNYVRNQGRKAPTGN